MDSYMKLKYNIPRKFSMGGQIIKVHIKRCVDVEGAIGYYKHHENEIGIQTHLNGSPIAVSQVEQTFWHEYAHCLLDHCREEELSTNEKLVDLLGEFLYQSLGKQKWD